MRNVASVVLLLVAVACAGATLFFAYYGTLLIYHSVTFDGEGSLGHVGMYIAAALFPLLTLFFGGVTLIAWRKYRQRTSGPPPA